MPAEAAANSCAARRSRTNADHPTAQPTGGDGCRRTASADRGTAGSEGGPESGGADVAIVCPATKSVVARQNTHVHPGVSAKAGEAVKRKKYKGAVQGFVVDAGGRLGPVAKKFIDEVVARGWWRSTKCQRRRGQQRRAIYNEGDRDTIAPLPRTLRSTIRRMYLLVLPR